MKKSLRIFVFTSVLVIIYLLLCYMFTPKNNNDYGAKSYFNGRSYETEDKNTIDCVAIGNSDLYSSLIPMQLYNDYGFTVVNCGVAKCSINMGYSFLKGAKKDNDIKVLIIEADFLYETRITGECTQALGDMRFLASPFLYHAKWKKANLKDYFNTPKKIYDYQKGYKFSKKSYNVKYKNYMIEKNNISIPKKNLIGLEKIISFCKKNNIEIFMYEAPSITSWNLTKSKQVSEYCNDKKIKFIDFNLIQDEISFDYKKDYRDNGNHLNHTGALKITNYLGKYISENYNLDNHKNNEKYNKWDLSLMKYLSDESVKPTKRGE